MNDLKSINVSAQTFFFIIMVCTLLCRGVLFLYTLLTSIALSEIVVFKCYIKTDTVVKFSKMFSIFQRKSRKTSLLWRTYASQIKIFCVKFLDKYVDQSFNRNHFPNFMAQTNWIDFPPDVSFKVWLEKTTFHIRASNS